MTKTRYRHIAAAVAAAAMIAVNGAPAHAAGDAATKRTEVTPVVGSNDYLVYAVSTYDATGLPAAKAQVYARAVDGRTTKLGVSKGIGELGSTRLISVVGHWLVGRVVGTRYAAWWNLADGHHGTIRLPHQVDVLTAVPGGGVTYMSRDGRLHETTIDGKHELVGRPFHEEPLFYYRADARASDFVTADTHGIAVGGDDGELKYFTFAHPGVARKLFDPLGHSQFCRAVDSAYAACMDGAGASENTPTDGVSLIPLDGSAPITTEGFPAGIGFHGDRVIWTAHENGPVGSLHSFAPGAAAPLTHHGLVGSTSIAAYGGLVLMNKTQDRLLFATSANHVTPLGT